MIDRLEELLDAVEELPAEEDSLTLEGLALPGLGRWPDRNADGQDSDIPGEREGRRPAEGQPDQRPDTPAEEGRTAYVLRKRTEALKLAARPDHAGELPPESGQGESGLAVLYRQVTEAALGANAAARGAAVAVAQETVAPAAGLTAGELDRAVRRDSRRYDGGMTIY